ncbi:MAG: ATP-binding protein [Bacteroidales bacterium]
MSKRLIAILLTLSAAAVLICISEFAPHFAPGIQLDKPNTAKLERRIERELKKSRELALNFFEETKEDCPSELFENGVDYFEDKLKAEGVQFFLFRGDTLCYWSSKIDISGVKFDTLDIALQKIQSDYFFSQWIKRGKNRILILNHLCSEYPYQNKYLKNTFEPAYGGLRDYKVSLKLVYNGIPVRANSVTNFYLVPVDSYRRSTIAVSKPIVQWVSFVLIIISIYLFFGLNIFRKRVVLKVFGFIGVIILIRIISIYFTIPLKTDGEFFGPQLFANSVFNSSLGDFLVNSIFIFICAAYIFINASKLYKTINSSSRILVIATAPIVIGMYVLVDGMFKSLILHSTLILETYRIFNVSLYSIVGYFSIALWVVSTFLISNTWLKLFFHSLKLKGVLIHLGVGVLLVAIFLVIVGVIPTIYGGLWAILTLGIFIFLKYTKREIINLRAFIVIISVLSVYSVVTVSDFSFQKEEDIRKVLAINLSSERDPVAEMLITPLYHKLLTDTLVREYIRNIDNYNVALYDHLRKEYFKNYLNRYQLRATVCLSNSVITMDAGNTVNCNQFFNGLIDKYGILIPSSRFFYLNLQNGSISYIGVIGYRYGDELRNLYIELDSRPSWELLGYPELLIEGRGMQPMLKGYSWAKYHKGSLITQAGSFPYKTKLDSVNFKESSYDLYNYMGYNHLVYHPNKEDSVILSKPREDALNTTASFAYNLIFFFVVIFILMKWAKFPVQLRSPNPSFKNRISWAISLIIILSMVMVAAATILYNIKSFNLRNEKNLSEKLMSVMFELDRDIFLINNSGKDIDRLTDRLIELSNIFYTDINIYDISGVLKATSRPEMFEKQLLGRRMNPAAWNAMAYMHSPKFVNTENIGRMTFLSAYVPIIGQNNKTIAYLNLPYFTKQEELRSELYSIIVAIINIYALLALLAIVVALLISGQITRPLELIRERISMVNIAGNNEQINYSGNDEVGQLIREYNRMVDELAWSAKELARSQRESAWREMAKQIAHEVKNPLTPMKLSLQYLVKAKKDCVPDWDQRFERFSESLVEQINSLTSIANEFSSFAKLPTSNISQVNLYKLLSDIVTLYSGYKSMTFTFTNSLSYEPIVMADRDQLLRVFNNLVKNAIQAIEKGMQGEIGISILFSSETVVKVEVSDNGIGIPDDVLAKLFTPNFTTKSGGSGLGLAITREIIHGFGGNIKVRTQVGEGTTFSVELPLAKKEEV